MDQPLVAEPECAECGRPTARAELVPPEALPSRWEAWTAAEKKAWHPSTKWRFLYEGPAGGNGLGDEVEAGDAERYRAAFEKPFQLERILGARLYDNAGYCVACERPYCAVHWKLSDSGAGRCPRGHFASLDPNWSP